MTLPTAPEPADDRHTCAECARLRDGVCTAAGIQGAVLAQRGWQPSELWRTVPHRCAAFSAETNVPRRFHGAKEATK